MLYEDAERAWKYLVEEQNTSPGNIVIYGHSLGGAVAVDLASKHPEAGALIAEGALTSIADRAAGTPYAAYLSVRLILTVRFDSISKIESIHLPKLILQGEADTMAPPLMARRLYDAAPDPKQMALIPNGGHEDSAVVNATAYFTALNGFPLSTASKPGEAPQGDNETVRGAGLARLITLQLTHPRPLDAFISPGPHIREFLLLSARPLDRKPGGGVALSQAER